MNWAFVLKTRITLAYSFRTSPFLDELRQEFGDIFVFGKLTEDLEKFKQLVRDKQPDLILGIAATKGSTRYEPIAINRFGRDKTIVTDGPEQLSLAPFPGLPFAVKPTSAFCNWTMYKFQLFLNETGSAVLFSFIHLNHRDLERLRSVQ